MITHYGGKRCIITEDHSSADWAHILDASLNAEPRVSLTYVLQRTHA